MLLDVHLDALPTSYALDLLGAIRTDGPQKGVPVHLVAGSG